LVHHPETLEERTLVLVGDGRLPPLVVPEHLRRREGNDQVVSLGAGFLEKLEMPGVQDVVASADEDFFHAGDRKRCLRFPGRAQPSPSTPKPDARGLSTGHDAWPCPHRTRPSPRTFLPP